MARILAMKRLLILAFTLTLANAIAEFREWTSADGRTLLAEFISVSEGKVTIKRRNDGRSFTLPLEKLSEADQTWLKENSEKAAPETSNAPSKELDRSDPLVKLVTGSWERHESHKLKFRLFGERKLLRSSPGLTNGPTSFPLVIYLHGKNGDVMTGEKPWSADTFANSRNYRDRPCFIIAPQAPKEDETWGGRNGDNVIKITEDLIKSLPIDEKRIYITGYSMGAFGTFHLLGREPKMFAAAVPIAGGGKPAAARSHKDVPVWVFHGAKDIIVEVERSQRMVEAMKKARAEVKYTELPYGDHGIAGQVYNDKEVHQWMFAQKRK